MLPAEVLSLSRLVFPFKFNNRLFRLADQDEKELEENEAAAESSPTISDDDTDADDDDLPRLIMDATYVDNNECCWFCCGLPTAPPGVFVVPSVADVSEAAAEEFFCSIHSLCLL